MLPRPSLLLLLRHLSFSSPSPSPYPHHTFAIPPLPAVHASDLWISKALATSFLLLPSSSSLPRWRFINPSPLVASLAVARVRSIAGAHSVFGLFVFARDQLLVKHSVQTYRMVVGSLSMAGQMVDALKLFDEMLAVCRCSPDENFVGFLIESCVASGFLDSALQLLSRARDFGFRLGPSRYNNIMTGLINANRPNDAIVFFKEQLGLNRFTPDVWSFNIALKAFCSLGDVHGALELLDKMRKLGYSPDTVTHNILVNGLCKANQADRAYSLLKRIQLEGLGMPNVVTYTSVISAYCKSSEMHKAGEVFDEMIELGIKPNRVTYNVLIDGYGKNGDMHLACSMYDSMILGGCPADIVTITSLINGYCINNRLDDAMRLWHEMGLKGLRPNVYTFSIMIHYLCKINRLEEALQFLRDLTNRRDIVPKAFVYNPVLYALCRIGNVDEANRILFEMEKRKGYPDKYTYTILMIGHCTKGRMEEAITLFYRMCDSGCNPDNTATYSLVSCLLKAGLPNQASLIMSRSNSDTYSVKDDHLALVRKSPAVSVAV